MPKWTSVSALALSVSLGAGGAVSADITPADVWASWQEMSEAFGQDLAAAGTETSGGSLILSGVTSEIAIEDGVITGSLGEVVLQGRDDGTVAISISPDYSVTISAAPEDDEAVDITMSVPHSGLSIVASGVPEAINYDYVASQLGIVIEELKVDNEPFEIQAEMLLDTLSGAYRAGTGDLREIESTMRAETASFNMAANEPEGDGAFSLNASFDGIESNSQGVMPSMFAVTDMAGMIADGFSSSGGLSHGPATYEVAFDDDGDNFAAAIASTSGLLDVSMSEDGLIYAVGYTGLEAAVRGSEIPFPQVTFSAGETLTEIRTPLVPRDTADPFALIVRLVDVAVGEEIWSMADPAGALPRDPATLVVNLSGTARLLANLFDPDLAMAGPPGEIETLAVEEIKLSIAGAELTGDGGFDFDNSTMGPVPGMPAAEGEVDLKLVGGNGLIDRLVQIGLLPEDQAMGARMMLGLFARPGEGEDTLTSTIGVTPDGGIVANGQRIN